MTRGTAAALTTPLRSTDDAAPVWLVRIATGLTSPTYLRYHDQSQVETITFDGEAYSPWGMDVPESRLQASTETGTVPLRLADPAGTLGGYVLSRGLLNQRVNVRLTDRAVIDAAGTTSLRHDYFIEGADMEEGAVTLALRPLYGVFGIEVPGGTITRADYPGLPRVAG